MVLICMAVAAFARPAAAADAAQLERLALGARLQPAQRDALVQQIAAHLQAASANKAQLRRQQNGYARALLLVCDHDVIGTLSPATREAVDDAIESAIGLDDIRSGGWDRLAYVYGFFNHDVTPEQIERIAQGWRDMTEAQRRRVYPTYPHLIDAMCKPLSVSGLGDDAQTDRALRTTIPLLKEMALGEPRPGRAFHPPTHAALVLGELYARWCDDATHGPLVRRLLGEREAFAKMLADRLIGAQPANQLDRTAVGFYAYTGRYFANTLARLDARSAAPVLRRSLALYEEKGAGGSTVAYTRRALVALGDAGLRDELETKLAADPRDPASVELLVWLCRNGRGETAVYGRKLLAQALGCEPAAALKVYFERRLSALGGPVDG